MLQEPTSAPHSWERKVGTLCLGQAVEDLVSFEETRKKGGRGQFLACFSLSSEDLTEALLEFTAALTYLEMLPPFPLSWQLVGLKTQDTQSWCDWFEGPRAKGLSGNHLENPSSTIPCHLQPSMPPLLLFLRMVSGCPCSFVMKSSLIFHTEGLNPATF